MSYAYACPSYWIYHIKRADAGAWGGAGSETGRQDRGKTNLDVFELPGPMTFVVFFSAVRYQKNGLRHDVRHDVR